MQKIWLSSHRIKYRWLQIECRTFPIRSTANRCYNLSGVLQTDVTIYQEYCKPMLQSIRSTANRWYNLSQPRQRATSEYHLHSIHSKTPRLMLAQWGSLQPSARVCQNSQQKCKCTETAQTRQGKMKLNYYRFPQSAHVEFRVWSWLSQLRVYQRPR